MMNRADAAAILQIDPAASQEEARRAYQDLFNEGQLRLTNAPTPALRNLYQARLRELEEARDAMLAQTASDDSDLPLAEPVIPGSAGPSWQTSAPGATSPPPVKPPSPPPPVTPPPVKSPPVKPPPVIERQPEPPPPPPRQTTDAELTKKAPEPSGKRGLVAAGAIAVIVIGAFLWTRRDKSPEPEVVVAPADTTYKDSLPLLKQNIANATVEFSRGNYNRVNAELQQADNRFAVFPATADSDTLVSRLKTELSDLHSKIKRACEAENQVARQRNEPLKCTGG